MERVNCRLLAAALLITQYAVLCGCYAEPSVGHECQVELQQERPKPNKERFIHGDCILVELAGYLEMSDGSGFVELKNGRVIAPSQCNNSYNSCVLNVRYDNCAEIGMMFTDRGAKGNEVRFVRFGLWHGDELKNHYIYLPAGFKAPTPGDHYRCDSEQALDDWPSYEFHLHVSQVQIEVFRNSTSEEFITTPHVCPMDARQEW